MKKILFLVNHDVVIYNFRYELVKKLRDMGYEVIISSPNGERIRLLEKIGCKFEETDVARHGTNPVTDLKLVYTYVKLLKKHRPDFVFTYTIKPNIYGAIACALMNIPCIANITGLGTVVENKGILQKMTLLMYKMAFSKVQKVFFQNEENMQFFRNKKIALGRYGLLPGSGVNLDKFSYMDYPPEGVTEFAFISRIMKEKGIEQYLDAARYIKGKYPQTVFHICGFCEEAYEKELDELDAKGIIKYHGMVGDVREVLKDVHCVIHPTYYPEGLSNVLLEASACGRPIITTDRSGCREVIGDGINGYICKQKDSEDLIKQIEKFMKLPYEEKNKMGIAGRKKVESEFDRQIVVEAYMDEIMDVTEKEGSI